MRNSHRRTSLAIAAAFFLALFASTLGWSQKPDILEKIGIHTGFTVDREIMVPMRDGIRLSTAVLRPEKIAERMAVILVRTPYLKDEELLGLKDLFSFMLQHGYILVVQSERGTGWSEGQYRILAGARNDGYDTLSWIVAQPWSNGKMGVAKRRFGVQFLTFEGRYRGDGRGPGRALRFLVDAGRGCGAEAGGCKPGWRSIQSVRHHTAAQVP
jgi:hypothetical protein